MKIKERIVRVARLLFNNPTTLILRLYILMRGIGALSKIPVRKKINDFLFEYDLSFSSAIKMMYAGEYENSVVSAMKKILKKGDTFIDVGANIGYITAIGASLVGKTGQVHSFEPVPAYFSKLKKTAKINPDFTIVINQYALAEKSGAMTININNCKNIGWNTLVPGLMRKEEIKEVITISTCRLDDYIREKELGNIALIKIDVEGYEFPVLKGLSGYLESTGHRPIIICEVAPCVYPLLGYELIQLSEYLKKYNYSAYSLDGTATEIDLSLLHKTSDLIFVYK